MASSGAIEIPFLGEWSQLRRERRELRERLAKLEYEAGKYSDSVLARVRIDYERRIHDLESRASDLAERARREVASLTLAVEQQEAEIRTCRMALEEFDLRETLGEKLDDESAARVAEGRQELSHLEDDLRAMRELLDRVRAIAELRTGSSIPGPVPAGGTGPIATFPAPPPPASTSSSASGRPIPALTLVPPPPPPPLADEPALPVTVIQPPTAAPQFPPRVDHSFPPYSPTVAITSIKLPRLVPIDTADSADHFVLRPKTIVGRTAECDLRLPVGTVSRRHAEVEWTEEGWRIHDLQSENGTWVNGERAFDRLLVDGDRLQFGTVCLVFKSS